MINEGTTQQAACPMRAVVDQGYSVIWRIEVGGADPVDAAFNAWDMAGCSGTLANVFEVTDSAGVQTVVDLADHGL